MTNKLFTAINKAETVYATVFIGECEVQVKVSKSEAKNLVRVAESIDATFDGENWYKNDVSIAYTDGYEIWLG